MLVTHPVGDETILGALDYLALFPYPPYWGPILSTVQEGGGDSGSGLTNGLFHTEGDELISM